MLERIPLEPSVAVREAIIKTLRTASALSEVATKAYHKTNRLYALERLRKVSSKAALAVQSEHNKLGQQVKALGQEKSSVKLTEVAVEGAFDELRIAAAKKLTALTDLEAVALKSEDRDVLSIVLAGISEKEKGVLERVAQEAADPAMKLAALKKSGAQSWVSIFESHSSLHGAGNCLAAVALFKNAQKGINAAVEQACLQMIRRGDESRIPEMASLLEQYGSKILAEDYLNCGQPDLYDSGAKWGRKRGYNIRQGDGSHRASWGR